MNYTANTIEPKSGNHGYTRAEIIGFGLGGSVLFIGSIAMGFWMATEDDGKAPATERYISRFTDSGKCLDGSAYDPDNGAKVTLNKDNISGQNILSVIPRTANSENPSVLYFTADEGQINFADHQTGSLLVEHGCIDKNSGS